MRQHLILCGLGKVGLRVLEYLRQAGEPVTVIDSRCDANDARLEGVRVIRGDCRQAAMLEQAGLAEARGVIVLTSDDLVSLSTALMVRHLNPNIRIIVRMFNQNLITRLGDAARNMQALSTSALAAPLLAMIARTGQALGMVQLQSGARRQITELTIAAQSPLIGRPLGELATENGFTVVAHMPSGQPARFVQAVDLTAKLGPDDRLVVFGDPAALAPFIARGENESLPELLWAGLVRRFTRVLYRVLSLIDLPVKIGASIFLAVIVVSVVVFHFGMKHDTLIDAFYRTISLLATGADMHGEEAEAGSWQKAFITSLRLVGMILTAGFTAIFTNYLIRANLGAALEVRRIPESGHVIVCGLGNIGFRVVEELRAQREPVVVIEQNPSGPFISTARRLGAAVIIGNAAVAEVLRQARAASARAVVAATSNELLNLEITLLVREMAPRQRVVVRLTDPHLAMTLRHAANVRLALSIPELSAPAFVASLYDNQVYSLFQVEGRVLAVYELAVPDAVSPFCGKTLRTLTATFGFLPVYHSDAAGHEQPITPDNVLAVGARLTGIIAVEHLQQLFQGENRSAVTSRKQTT
jgi:Trk K+ transport system NAD-binding subunit